MSNLRRTAVGFAWNHIGRVVEFFLAYLFSVVVARHLGAEINGQYATLLSLVQFLLVVSSLGLETSALARLPATSRHSNPTEYSNAVAALISIRLLAGAIVLLVGIALRSVVASALQLPPHLVDSFWIVLLYFFVRGAAAVQIAVYTARMQTGYTAVVGVAVRLVEVLAAIFLLVQGLGVVEVIGLLTITASFQVGILLFGLWRDVSLSTSRLGFLPIVRDGLGFWATSLVEFALGKPASILLLGFLLVGSSAVGHFDVAVSFGNLINFGMTTGFAGISIAAFASVLKSDREQLARYWETLTRMIGVLVIPPFVFSVWFAPVLLPFVYGTDFLSSVPLFQLFAVFLLATRFLGGGVAADYLQAAARKKELLLAGVAGGATNIILALVLIPSHGGQGAIVASGIAALVIAGAHAYFVAATLPIKLPIRTALLTIISSLVAAGGTTLLVPSEVLSEIVLTVVIFAALFGVSAFILRPLDSEDVAILSRINRSLASFAGWFACSPKGLGQELKTLTDRQKWAFGWMPHASVAIDVGSSSSPLTRLLHLKGTAAFAIDTDRDALRQVLDQASPIVALQSSAHQLPFQSNSVDVLTLLDVLEHINDDRAAIDEALRVLRPGGMLVLSVPNKGLFRFLDPENLSSRLRGAFSSRPAHRHYSDSDVTRLLFLKFRIVRKHYGGLFLYPITFALNHFFQTRLRLDWGKFFKKIGDIDNDISWGKLSYNVIILAEKI